MMREFREAVAEILRSQQPELPPALSEFIRITFELEVALELGFTVTLAEVSPLEFRALVILREERGKFEEEERRIAEAQASLKNRGSY